MFLVPIGIVLVIAYLVSNIVIVPQAKAYVIERLGTYHDTWEAGLHLKIPFIERIVRKVSLKEQVLDFEPQPVITKDNVTMHIDSVVYLKYFDAKALTYGVENAISAVENLTATTLRNIIGSMDLDQSLTSRDEINARMRAILDEATDPWGIRITRVELKNIMPPKEIQSAMEKQMRAERERRESILKAEGHKESQVLMAQGDKEAAVLRAQAEKEVKILQSEAEREARMHVAEGEAAAILKVSEAKAQGLERIKQVQADDGLVRLQALDALRDMAAGQATTIVVPCELQGLAGTLAGLTETVKAVSAGDAVNAPAAAAAAPKVHRPVEGRPSECAGCD